MNSDVTKLASQSQSKVTLALGEQSYSKKFMFFQGIQVLCTFPYEGEKITIID
jgi:hypothetical protein